VTRAVFLDRDGVINEMVNGPEGPDSPKTVEEFKLLPGVSASVRRLNELGLPVVVVSNQPGVAKGKFPAANLEAMTMRMEDALGNELATLQGIYYCMHHPDAIVAEYRDSCDCRKPKPGLLVQAAMEMNLGLAGSYMVGDQRRDMIAGKSVGCTTFLIGAEHLGAKPDEADHICGDLGAAVRLIAQLESTPSPRRQGGAPGTGFARPGAPRGESPLKQAGWGEPINSDRVTLRNFRETRKPAPFIH
jgi:D-glycero-D-manno-heptose 1,7-bisphosphate phosphatase